MSRLAIRHNVAFAHWEGRRVKTKKHNRKRCVSRLAIPIEIIEPARLGRDDDENDDDDDDDSRRLLALPPLPPPPPLALLRLDRFIENDESAA